MNTRRLVILPVLLVLAAACQDDGPSSARSLDFRTVQARAVAAIGEAGGKCNASLAASGTGFWQYQARANGWLGMVSGSSRSQFVRVHLRDEVGRVQSVSVRIPERLVIWIDRDSTFGDGSRSILRSWSDAGEETRSPRGREVLRLVDLARTSCAGSTQ